MKKEKLSKGAKIAIAFFFAASLLLAGSVGVWIGASISKEKDDPAINDETTPEEISPSSTEVVLPQTAKETETAEDGTQAFSSEEEMKQAVDGLYVLEGSFPKPELVLIRDGREYSGTISFQSTPETLVSDLSARIGKPLDQMTPEDFASLLSGDYDSLIVYEYKKSELLTPYISYYQFENGKLEYYHYDSETEKTAFQASFTRVN